MKHLTQHFTKKLLAVLLAALLIVGAVPVFANETANIAVVEVGYTVTEEGVTGEDGYPRYSTPGAAIDSFKGEGGTVWFKGIYSGTGADLEGTIDNRADVVFEGYNSTASGNGITFADANYGAGANGSWAKGNITFKNMTLDVASGNANGTDCSLASGGYTFTFDTGVVSGSSNNFMIATNSFLGGSSKDMNIIVNGATLRYIHAVTHGDFHGTSPTIKLNTNINVNGGSVNYISPSSGGSTSGSTTGRVIINGDFNANITGGSVSNINFFTRGYGSDVQVLGDTIFRISGGSVNNIYMSFNQGDKNFVGFRSAGYVIPERGNMAVIIDASKTTKAVIGATTGVNNLEYVKMAANKYTIGIINNYTGSGCIFDTTKTYTDLLYNATDKTLTSGTVEHSILDRYDYKITVTGGEAQPVFVRTNADDPSTSTLKGFTIVPNTKGLTPAINGVKLVPTGETTANGLDIYDLSAYKSSRDTAEDDTTITAITFVDERIPVVTTDESFTPDESIYKKVATLPEAINTLGKDGGKIYIYGTFAPAKDAIEGSIENRGEIIIAGYGDTAAGGTFVVPKATYGSGMNGKWTKGDVKFENITIDAVESSGTYGSDVSISSGDYKVTFGEGIQTGTYRINVAANTYKGNNINVDIHSGNYQIISALTNSYYHGAGNNFGPYNMNVNVNIYGGDVESLYTISGSNYFGINRTNYINGDVIYNVNGGTVRTVNLVGYAYASDVLVYGDTIFNINGGSITDKIKAQLDHFNLTTQSDYVTPERGNMALVVDAAKVEKAVIGYGYGVGSLDYFKMAEGKYLIGIINNYDKANSNVGFNTFGYSDKAVSETNRCVLDRYDYKLTVSGGEAQPVFKRTNANDPATSYLQGFSITPSEENEGKLVVVNGTDVITAENGLYDLSAYKADRADASDDALITSITFLAATELPTTSEEFTPEEFEELKKPETAAPEKEGYLFAGWYESASSETAMTAAQLAEAETAVAKFIPKAVLDIKWQIAKGEDGKANLRLISTVDSLQYQKVIFNVDVVGRETPFKPLESTTVYTGISGYVDGNEQNYAPTINSASSAYFMTHIIKGIPVDFHDNNFTVTASVVTKDGKVITGDPITFQLKNATDYDKVMGN